MSGDGRPATGAAPPGRERRRPVRPLLAWVTSGLALGVVAAAVAAFFLWIYIAKHYTVPLGWDTSHYLWDTERIRTYGLAGLRRGLSSSILAIPGRPAFPILVGAVSSVANSSPFRVAAVLPAVIAASIGLSAGALVGALLRRSAWELVAVAIAVGTSFQVLRLAGPETYQDNLLAAAVFLTAAIPLGISLKDRRALPAAILLMGAGGVIHWALLAVMIGVMGLTAAAYLPESWRSWRAREAGLLDTPAARLGGVALGASAVAGAVILGVVGTAPKSPKLSVGEFLKKLRADLHKYRFPVVAPLAVVGAGALAVEHRNTLRRAHGDTASPDGPIRIRSDGADRGPKFLLAFLLAWCAVTLAAVVAGTVFHLRVPVHRFLAFNLALPLLAVIGLLALARLLWRFARPVAVALVVIALGGSVYLAHGQWFHNHPWMDPAKVQDAATTGAYLAAARVPEDATIVVLLDNRGKDPSSYTALMLHMLRAGLPVGRVPHTYAYVGTPDNYLLGRPTFLPGQPNYNKMSQRYFAIVKPTYARDPVVVIPRAFNRAAFREWAATHPGSVGGVGVAVVQGPALPAPVPQAPTAIGPFRAVLLFGLAGGMLLGLALVGLGWTLALLGRWLDRFQTLAVAPAVGVAAVVVLGAVADRLGVRMRGLGGEMTPLAIGVLGWVAGIWAGRRRASHSRGPGATREKTSPTPLGVAGGSQGPTRARP